jgi:hypothetical protein
MWCPSQGSCATAVEVAKGVATVPLQNTTGGLIDAFQTVDGWKCAGEQMGREVCVKASLRIELLGGT